MNGFGRELVKTLKGKKRDQENPLEIVGLSPAILELGLSRDELYEHCRKIARDLLARVHPDKHGGIITPAVLKYSEAFNLLDNRKVFDEALTEFRETHSYERREETTLRQQIANLQGEFKFQSEQLKKEIAARKEDMKIRKWVYWRLAAKLMKFSSDKIKPLTHREQFAVMSLEFIKFSSPPSKGKLEKFKEIYGANPSQEEVKQLTGAFYENRLGAKKLSSLIARALDSGFKTPAIRWSVELGARELGFRELVPHLSHIERGGIIRDALMPWSSAKIQKYRQILKVLSLVFGDKHIVEASITPDNVKLEDQFLRGDSLNKFNKSALSDLYVLGTVEPDIGFTLIRGEKFSQTKKDPTRLTMEKDILFHIDPFLSAERAVICIRPPMKRFSLSADNLKAQWNNLYEKKGGMEQMPTFCLSHIIVDV